MIDLHDRFLDYLDCLTNHFTEMGKAQVFLDWKAKIPLDTIARRHKISKTEALIIIGEKSREVEEAKKAMSEDR